MCSPCLVVLLVFWSTFANAGHRAKCSGLIFLWSKTIMPNSPSGEQGMQWKAKISYYRYLRGYPFLVNDPIYSLMLSFSKKENPRRRPLWWASTPGRCGATSHLKDPMPKRLPNHENGLLGPPRTRAMLWMEVFRYLGHPVNHQRPCFWYLKTKFFGDENLCFSWFRVFLLRI